MQSDDMTLVREFAATQSEPAFAALVARHLDLVYSAALRRVGNAHLAQEIAQAVFIILARKAARLGPQTILSGWLYRTTQFAAADALKQQRRRQQREHEAHMQSTLNSPDTDETWRQIAPLLEAAMDALSERDRNAVVLRYFENKTLAEVGTALGMSEDGARVRVNRALEKLRNLFSKRGVTLTATVIAGAVAANSVQAAPVGLAVNISTAIFTGTTLTATTAIVMTTFQKAVIASVLAAAVGAGVYEAKQANNALAEVQALHQQQAGQFQQLLSEHEDATNRLANLQDENERLKRMTTDLARLRGETARLRQQTNELATLRAENYQLRSGAQARSSQSQTDQEWDAKRNACLNNLRMIDGAMQQCALEHNLSATNIVTADDIKPYIGRGDGQLPICPAGGLYSFGVVTNPPTCSVSGHALPWLPPIQEIAPR